MKTSLLPHITTEQANLAFTGAVAPLELLNIYNARIEAHNKANEIARAEQAKEQPLITREEAQKLQADLGDMVEWRLSGVGCISNSGLNFEMEGVYSYKLKANLVKLDSELMTREAAIAKYEAVKDKCDCYTVIGKDKVKNNTPKFDVTDTYFSYELRAKPLKQVSWKDVPVGVAVQFKIQDSLTKALGFLKVYIRGVGYEQVSNIDG